MALKYANISYIHREVKLSERPKELYKISSKGTVPVLNISDSEIAKKDSMISSESTLKGLKLINYCSFKNQKRIQATVEFSTKSLKEALKLESTLKLNENKKNQN